MRRLWPLLAVLLSCGRPDPKPAEPLPPTPLLLFVSFDTTRADALGCYGGEGARTPTLDALAARGVRFELALAHAPTTLSSHTSVLSGLDPHGHTVPRNGYPVPASLPLLTERLRGEGWDTLAVVGASALSSTMGLNRGFRLYDDSFGRAVGRREEEPAEGVLRRALAQLDQRAPGKPLFLFVHFYDPHVPWDSAPPEVQRGFLDPSYDGPAGNTDGAIDALVRRVHKGTITLADLRQARGYYLAEVSWADQQLGLLLDALERQGLMQDSLVVMFSDHGESMGEATSMVRFGHGPDVDLPEIHVPLLVAGRGRYATPQGQVVSRQVRLMDVATTTLSALGLQGTMGEGEDLRPLWTGQSWEAPPSFAEATMPVPKASRHRWNNLPLERSVAFDGLLEVWAPWRNETPRLYRLAPGQPEATGQPGRLIALKRLLEAWDDLAPPHRGDRIAPEVQRQLEALGYVEEDPSRGGGP